MIWKLFNLEKMHFLIAPPPGSKVLNKKNKKLWLSLDGIAYTFGIFLSPLMEDFNVEKEHKHIKKKFR